VDSRAFDPDLLCALLERLAPVVADYVRRAQAGEGKVIVQPSIDELLGALDFENVVARGGDLESLVRWVLDASNHLQNPRYMGHQVAIPMIASALADLVHGVTNNGMAVYEMGPAGTAIERGLVRWALAKLSWQKTGDGVLTHGGSLANLGALLAARGHALPRSWHDGVGTGAVVLASEVAHYSIARVVSVLGLGASALVRVAVDDRLRMRPEALAAQLDAERRAGRTVMAVVASAGATATGSFDPLLEISAVCRERDVWLHVDGAHGASLVLSSAHRHALAGVEQADSLTWDAHKLLGTSALCAFQLVREREALASSYKQQASYLLSDDDRPGEDLSRLTFECTKALLSLKLFFNLALVGEAGLAQHVAHLVDRTRLFYETIRARAGFECFASPECNILCFRYGTDSALQDRIREQLVQEGDFYITRATIAGASWLRIVVMNPLTDTEHVEALCRRIEQLGG
jgi:L-2,4-diaminobutyrate decarboxylase